MVTEGRLFLTEAELAERHRGGSYPASFAEVERAVAEGRDIGWYGEEFLVSEVERLREALEKLLPDVQSLIRDHYSGLPEDREPVNAAVTRLDYLLNDEDGEPTGWPFGPKDSA